MEKPAITEIDPEPAADAFMAEIQHFSLVDPTPHQIEESPSEKLWIPKSNYEFNNRFMLIQFVMPMKCFWENTTVLYMIQAISSFSSYSHSN